MARGGGGRSGGSRSSGSRSSSRSSGGHRSSGSSSGRSSSSRSSFSSSGRTGFGGSGYHYRPPRSYTPRTTYSRPYYGGGTTVVNHNNSGCLSSVVTVIIVLAILVFVFASIGGSNVPASTINREKVNTGVAFHNDCVLDEAGWIDNKATLSRGLQHFYNKTGIQPFIYIKAYDPELKTDDQKLQFANDWYEQNIDNEGTFLYVYFEEQNDYGDGYMCYVNGKEITTVMDAEAIDIFWSYIDSVWESNMDDEEMFIHVFTKTADRIMDKSTTGADIGKWVVIGLVVVAGGFIVIKVMKTKRQHEKEKNEETERILNTPLGGTTLDDLADKYTSNTEGD